MGRAKHQGVSRICHLLPGTRCVTIPLFLRRRADSGSPLPSLVPSSDVIPYLRSHTIIVELDPAQREDITSGGSSNRSRRKNQVGVKCDARRRSKLDSSADDILRSAQALDAKRLERVECACGPAANRTQHRGDASRPPDRISESLAAPRGAAERKGEAGKLITRCHISALCAPSVLIRWHASVSKGIATTADARD